MQLGAASVSLAVKDLAASQAFYEKFGFTFFAGEPANNWVILKNGDCVIGLFQGMFERNSSDLFRETPSFRAGSERNRLQRSRCFGVK